jgi:hypothetical protein
MQVNGSGAEDAEKTARKALESVRAKWVLKVRVDSIPLSRLADFPGSIRCSSAIELLSLIKGEILCMPGAFVNPY